MEKSQTSYHSTITKLQLLFSCDSILTDVTDVLPYTKVNSMCQILVAGNVDTDDEQKMFRLQITIDLEPLDAHSSIVHNSSTSLSFDLCCGNIIL